MGKQSAANLNSRGKVAHLSAADVSAVCKTNSSFFLASGASPPRIPNSVLADASPSLGIRKIAADEPQMPMRSYVGTNATAKVASPMSSSVAISVDFRPMRSP